jgi:putative Holliday junction resolvase
VGRLLGVDLGSKRIGFAVSDPDRIIATAFRVVECQNDGHIVNSHRQYLPRSGRGAMRHRPSDQHGRIERPGVAAGTKFKTELAEKLGRPVVLWDERLTTKSAHDALIEAGTRREKRKGLVDKIAAQIMLQHYLDAHGA